jgi:hypothetical protein
MNSSTKNGNGQIWVLPEKQGVPYQVGNKRPPRHTQFKPGVSGNPGGVRKGTVFVSECYKRLILFSPEELADYEPANVAEAIALKQIRNAMETEEALIALPSAKEVTDRTEGKAPQRMDLTANAVNITQVQIQMFVTAAADLAARHNVPVELAQERMLALAGPLRPALEAALATVDGGGMP